MQTFATPTFIQQFEEFCKSRPVLRDKMKSFLEFRLAHPNGEPFNAKDTMYTGTSGGLSGYRHVHLWLGKGIVTYTATPKAIHLYCMTPHDASEKSAGLRKFLDHATDFVPFSLDKPAEQPNGLSADDVQKVEGEVYDLAGADDPSIRAALHGDVREVVEWLLGNIGDENTPENQQKFLAHFGGQDGFVTYLRDVRKKLGLREGRTIREWIDIVEATWASR